MCEVIELNKYRFAFNEYGQKVLSRNCDVCGNPYTVCPYPENVDDWQVCLDESCDSYDESRDVDKLINAGLKVVKDETSNP